MSEHHMAQGATDAALTGECAQSQVAQDTPFGVPDWPRALWRQALGLALLAGFALVLRDRWSALDPAAIWAAVGAVSALQWSVAALATFASFAALAQYDALMHRVLATRQTPSQARRAGWVAIAISQTVGFGLVSGALVRWRMLPGSSLRDASRLTAAVAASFLAAWAMLSAAVMLVAPVSLSKGLPQIAVQGLAAMVLFGGGALIAPSLWWPGGRIGRWSWRLPSLPAMGRILWLAAADTVCAALALWALMPEASGITFTALYPAFLIALGAGFVSGTPGGVGPFELMLVLLLPDVQSAPLLGAVLAWRAAYYGAPAILAMFALIFAQRGAEMRLQEGRAAPATPLSARAAALIAAAPQAELGLLHQGEHGVLLCPDHRAGWMIGRTPQALVGLIDPFGPTRAAALLPDLRSAARAEGRIACLYKIGARTAVAARRAGWTVAPVAMDCRLDPRRFDPGIPARAGLRRKLRKAARAGLVCTPARQPLPLAAMARIAADWAASRGGERGFSMGRFAPDYLTRQEVILAHLNGRLVGFASFHANAQEWTLDLMRPGADAPDGTMQTLIATALDLARTCGARQFSLAALPPDADHIDGPAALIWRRAETGAGYAGLRQFKMGFAPRLVPLYIAAPGRAALALAAADIARTIRRPPPLPGNGDAPPHAAGSTSS